MFRVKGENRQDRQYHVDLIWSVFKQDIGAAIILAAVYFEWCVKRCILALGKAPVAELRKAINQKEMTIDQLKDLWASEVQNENEGINTLPDTFDKRKGKPIFDDLRLTWQTITFARKLRNRLVHGERCDPLEKNGKKYIEILIAACDVLCELAEKKKHPIFKMIRRHKANCPATKQVP